MIIHAPVPVFPLSIVIPAIDEAVALPGTLACLERQGSDPPFEVLLADGGSRDGTVARFAELTRDWPARGRLARVVRQGGVAKTAARFAGLKLRRALGASPVPLKARYPDVR